jgi:hypothetical protein
MHARPRKLSLAPPLSRDEIGDAFPSDDAVVIEMAAFTEESRANERICLACGGDGSRHEGCPHGEIARLHEPSRAAGEMIARLRRAAAEHRAASRALRALVTAELARGCAELDTTPIPSPFAASRPAAPPPCARCTEREAEMVAAVLAAPRPARKRGRAAVDQQFLPFAQEPESAADKDPSTP